MVAITQDFDIDISLSKTKAVLLNIYKYIFKFNDCIRSILIIRISIYDVYFQNVLSWSKKMQDQKF